MAELMVHKEARFDDMLIVAVYEHDDGTIEVTATSEKAEWFNPGSKHADPDGWVRNVTEATTTVELHFTDPERRALKLEILRRWREENTSVTGFSSFDEQAIGFVRRLDDGEIEAVAVRMPSADLDRV